MVDLGRVGWQGCGMILRSTSRLIPTCDAWYPNYAWLSVSAEMIVGAKRKPLGEYPRHRLYQCVESHGHPDVSLCPCDECVVDREWLATDPDKGRPKQWTADELRSLRGHVKGSVYLYNASPQWQVRVCFWGADDTGIECDTVLGSQEEAGALFERRSRWLSGLSVIERAPLFGMGFSWA